MKFGEAVELRCVGGTRDGLVVNTPLMYAPQVPLTRFSIPRKGGSDTYRPDFEAGLAHICEGVLPVQPQRPVGVPA